MKKLTLLAVIFVALFALVGCQASQVEGAIESSGQTEAVSQTSQEETVAEPQVLTVGATPVPHAVLLELVKEDLANQNITLKIVEFTDYIQPNLALAEGDLDANFFQHVPYQDNFSKEHSLSLSAIATVHVEPLGLYSKSVTDLNVLPQGATLGIPADAVNGGRALILLETAGLITLSEEAGLEATEKDIIDNPHGFKFVAAEAAQLPRVLEDVDAAVINGNYAIPAGLSPATDALLLEGSESPYANVITVRAGEEDNPLFAALVDALHSDKVKAYIEATYEGGVVPAFSK